MTDPHTERATPWKGYKLDRATREAILYAEGGRSSPRGNEAILTAVPIGLRAGQPWLCPAD